MINTLRGFDCLTNSPCQYQRKCIENSVENMGTDVRVSRVNSKSISNWDKAYQLNAELSILFQFKFMIYD